MSVYSVKLGSDVKSKFDRLCKMHDQPSVYVANFFCDLRKTIERDTETVLEAVSEGDRRSVMEMAAENLLVSNNFELEFIEKMPRSTKISSKTKFEALKRRCESFIARTKREGSTDELEEEYIELTHAIARERIALEMSIFNNEHVFFTPSNSRTLVGDVQSTNEKSIYKKFKKAARIIFRVDGYEFSLQEARNTLEILYASGLLTNTKAVVIMFSLIPNLREIILSHNQLRYIAPFAFNGVERLQILNLSDNNLNGANFTFLRDLVTLKALKLSRNGLSSLDLTLIFKSCRLLAHLDLSNNQLDGESINEAAFAESICLQELLVDNNRLEKVDFVRALPFVRRLDLSDNKIESVSESVMAQFKSGTCRIVFRRNPLKPAVVASLKDFSFIKLSTQ